MELAERPAIALITPVSSKILLGKKNSSKKLSDATKYIIYRYGE